MGNFSFCIPGYCKQTYKLTANPKKKLNRKYELQILFLCGFFSPQKDTKLIIWLGFSTLDIFIDISLVT